MATKIHDIFGETQPTSPTSQTNVAHRWPPPEHRSRAAEFYGFVAWTSTYILFIIYLLWAILPDEFIIWTGITWYPNREWAILLPAWTVMGVLFTYFAYLTLALAGTPSLDEMRSITDDCVIYPDPQCGRNVYLESTKPGALPELYDIPIGMVNKVLYQRHVGRQDIQHKKHL
ncbi:PIG-P-domain-containing protein [Coprinopsis marcescibilis]|uniref:PIG-P-domain-containing protein n=1 Tax=Coprinopsis marcescibilis TaxID=230819 RepID=A0A5C3KNF5_COPMA|nr:PIG-P-domain-containing protein [Coprinopsis marcescibilis]